MRVAALGVAWQIEAWILEQAGIEQFEKAQVGLCLVEGGRARALSCSMRAFCLSECFLAFW